MPEKNWERLNLPARDLRMIKINAAKSGLKMYEYVAESVKQYEKARGSSRQAQSPGTTTVKEAIECQPTT